MYYLFDEQNIKKCYDIFSEKDFNSESIEIIDNNYNYENEIQILQSPIKSFNNDIIISDNNTSYNTNLQKIDKLIQLNENREESNHNKIGKLLIKEKKELIEIPKEIQYDEETNEKNKFLPPFQYNYNTINVLNDISYFPK